MADNSRPRPWCRWREPTPADLTFEAFAEKWLANARGQQSANQQLNERGIVRRFSQIELEPGHLLGQRPIGLFTVDDWETAFVEAPHRSPRRLATNIDRRSSPYCRSGRLRKTTFPDRGLPAAC